MIAVRSLVFLLLGMGVVFGLWLGWKRWSGRPGSIRSSLAHGVCSWLGICMFMILLSYTTARRAGMLLDVTAGLLIVGGLVGVLVGFVRFAGESVVPGLILFHVLIAAGGVGLLVVVWML